MKINNLLLVHWINSLSSKEMNKITGNIETNPKYEKNAIKSEKLTDNLILKLHKTQNNTIFFSIRQKVCKFISYNKIYALERNFLQFKKNYELISSGKKIKLFISFIIFYIKNKFLSSKIQLFTEIYFGNTNDSLLLASRNIALNRTSSIAVKSFLEKISKKYNKKIIIIGSGDIFKEWNWQKKIVSYKIKKNINQYKIRLEKIFFENISEEINYYFKINLNSYINCCTPFIDYSKKILQDYKPKLLLNISNDYFLTDSINYLASNQKIPTYKYHNTIDNGNSYFYSSCNTILIPGNYQKKKLSIRYPSKIIISVGSLEMNDINKILNKSQKEKKSGKNILIIVKWPEEHYHNSKVINSILSSNNIPKINKIIIRGKFESAKKYINYFKNKKIANNIYDSINTHIADDLKIADYIFCATGGALYACLLTNKPFLGYCFRSVSDFGFNKLNNNFNNQKIFNICNKLENLQNQIDNIFTNNYYINNLNKKILFEILGDLTCTEKNIENYIHINKK